MLRKTIIALLAVAAVGLASPTVAFARGGGGFGGGGFHGGGGFVVTGDTVMADTGTVGTTPRAVSRSMCRECSLPNSHVRY